MARSSPLKNGDWLPNDYGILKNQQPTRVPVPLFQPSTAADLFVFNRAREQNTMSTTRAVVAASLLLVLGLLCTRVFSEAPANGDLRKAAEKQFQDGNFKDAYEGFRRLALVADTNPRQVSNDMQRAINCLRRINRVKEVDAFREEVIALHANNWRLLEAAARSYASIDHYGYIIAGEFERGQHRGGGKVVSSLERDRVRALQLMVAAKQQIPRQPDPDETDRNDVSQFYFRFAHMILGDRGYNNAWRLQYLTDLEKLPDYEPGWPHYGGQSSGAPVDAEGNPVYHETAATWEAATTDGQRWRFCLDTAVKNQPAALSQARRERANFLLNQFGVQTMRQYQWFFGRPTPAVDDQSDDKKDTSGTYELHTLGEDETIARLATGIKRFKLPDEHNFVKLYQLIGIDEDLAQIFENRRQYPRAAEYWRKALGKVKNSKHERDRVQKRIDQIVKNWGRFEPVMTQPASAGATVEYRFRNARQVSFEAHAIDVRKLLDDVKAYIESRPAQVDWQKINIGNIGHRLVTQNESKYIGEQVASWKLDLEPRERHVDRRITVSTPLQKAGAYLLTAKMSGGNTSKIVLWLSDTAIVKKPLESNEI